MKSLVALLAFGTLLSSPVMLQAKITRIVEKSFAVHAAGTLVVRTYGGEINVVTGPGEVVKVTAKEVINAPTEEKADVVVQDLLLTMDQQDANVNVTARHIKRGGWLWGSSPVEVSFTVMVPVRYNVDLGTSGGDIRVASIEGRARLRTSGGNIQVERAGGEAELTTSGGKIQIGSAGGRLSAITSGGDITATIEGNFKGDCSLTTSGGAVSATVDKSAAFDLRAHTSGGNVDVDGVTIAIEQGGLRKSSLSGKVNGGGPVLNLGSSGGDIRIRAK